MRILELRAPSGINVRGTPCRRATPRGKASIGRHRRGTRCLTTVAPTRSALIKKGMRPAARGDEPIGAGEAKQVTPLAIARWSRHNAAERLRSVGDQFQFLCELRTMSARVLESSDDVTVYLVLNDHGEHGIAYVETEPAKADLESTIQNFLTGQYGNALRVVAFNTAEGWSRDVSEDIAQELLQRAVDAGEDLGEDTQRFVDRSIAGTRAGAVDFAEKLKPDFEKRPAAPSVKRGPADIRQRPEKSAK